MTVDKPEMLVEVQYLPPVQTLAWMIACEAVTLEACETYQKGSYRNRCYIAGANGPLRLSVPLESGKHQQLPIREVRTDQRQPWARRHWTAIRSAYGRAPFFEHYGPDLAPIFTRPPGGLFDLNAGLLRRLIDLIDLPIRLRYSRAYTRQTTPGVIDRRDRIRPGGHTDPAFRAVRYPQLFEDKHGFLPNMSILDLLFCAGPRTEAILRASIDKNRAFGADKP